MISCCISGSSAPDMPLQVVQAKRDDAEAELLELRQQLASSRYSCTALEPGASEDFTQGLRVSQRGSHCAPAAPRRSRCADCWCWCSW